MNFHVLSLSSPTKPPFLVYFIYYCNIWHFTPEQKPDNNFSQPRKIFQFSIQPGKWIDDWKVGVRRILVQVGEKGIGELNFYRRWNKNLNFKLSYAWAQKGLTAFLYEKFQVNFSRNFKVKFGMFRLIVKAGKSLRIFVKFHVQFIRDRTENFLENGV